LTRRRLAARLKEIVPAWPAELIRAAFEETIRALAEALTEARPIALNGFGRLAVRRYANSRKRIGLLFRPAARLRKRLNSAPAE
jgi:nucleoid DNA-binding protein